MNEASVNPYLMGNYAPIHDELDIKELNVIGEIPKDLLGVRIGLMSRTTGKVSWLF